MKGLEVNSCSTEGGERETETVKIRLVGQQVSWRIQKQLKQEQNYTYIHTHTNRTQAYLQAYYVDQRLVGDVDVAQDLGDWHAGDQQVERHKQREDWSEPAGEEDDEMTGKDTEANLSV